MITEAGAQTPTISYVGSDPPFHEISASMGGVLKVAMAVTVAMTAFALASAAEAAPPVLVSLRAWGRPRHDLPREQA